MTKRENRRCPECGSKDVLLIYYGFIDDPDLIQQMKIDDKSLE